SPDGRRTDDLISYGVAPSSTVETSLTAILASAARVAHALAACGNPLSVTLQRSDAQGPQGCALIRQIVETYFRLGGFHLHMNLMDADSLRRAQADPLRHAAVTVRVSGYSARFVTVDKRWQDALIERAERGI
ncbi:MAG TPA: glycine radical domain-containing protein, partial [Armatimonadota bacterium]